MLAPLSSTSIVKPAPAPVPASGMRRRGLAMLVMPSEFELPLSEPAVRMMGLVGAAIAVSALCCWRAGRVA